MTQTMSAADAKAHFDEVTGRIVETGERVIVELIGDRRIVMISAEELERLPAAPPRSRGAINRLAVLHAMLREELGGRELNPDPVEMLRRVRNEEFE